MTLLSSGITARYSSRLAGGHGEDIDGRQCTRDRGPESEPQQNEPPTHPESMVHRVNPLLPQPPFQLQLFEAGRFRWELSSGVGRVGRASAGWGGSVYDRTDVGYGVGSVR